ncbi:MAG: GWxTD domain-containing protein [Candidatus Kapaibacteriota bacterium]
MKNLLYLLTFTLIITYYVTNGKGESPFFFDAICFKSNNNDSLSRIDVFILIPYSSLSFVKNINSYSSEINLTITIKDSVNKVLQSKTITKIVNEPEQIETLGFSGKFKDIYESFEIQSGKYFLEISFYDKNTSIKYTKSRSTNALNFSKYDFAISGIMFLSDVEEIDGEFKITPFLSDNLGDLKRCFLFLETYQNNYLFDTVDIVYTITNFKGKEVARSKRLRLAIKQNDQIYFPLQRELLPKEGSYILKVFALKKSNTLDSTFKDTDIIAVSERTFEITPSLENKVLANLEKSVKQLKYVAYQSDIDYINQASIKEEKLARFLDFWKKLDPSPSTEYNEAFEEYYERIYYADSNFKSYIEGWMTDRGMVYVVLGAPATIQKQTDFNYNRNYEIWNYSSRTFIFVDYSGFGDFRLYSPPTFSEKYVYRP